MAVGVVGPDGDESDPGATGGEEVGVVVRAPVVGHLQHVGPQVHAPPHQALLRLRAQVAGQQEAEAPHRHPDHQRQVVGLGAPGRDLRCRRQHLDRGRPDPVPVAGHQHLLPRPRTAQRPAHCGAAVVRRRQRAGRHRADLAAADRPGQATHVVGVQVGQQHQGQPVDPQPVQAAVDRGHLRTGVDQHPLPRAGGHDEGVALTDVAGNQDRLRGRPSPGRLAQRPADEDGADGQRQGQDAQARPPPQGERPGCQQGGQDQGTRRPSRPARGRVRQGGGRPGDEDQPADGPPRHPGEAVGQRRRHRAGHGRQQPQHRRRRHRRGGEQIRRQRHETDHAGQARDQRRGREAGGRAHGDGVGDQTGTAPAAQPARPARREQHDRRGRRHGEREARVPRQPGLDQEQHDDHPAQRRQRGARPARREGQQRHRPHRPCPQHAGRRPGQQHEAHQRQDRHHGLDPAVGGPPAQRSQHTAEHDRHVGTRDRGEVRQPGPPEVLLQHRVHPAGIADHQARKQPGRQRVQHPGRRRGQACPQSAGRALHPGRLAQALGRSARGHPCGHPVRGIGGADDGAAAHPLAGQEA